MHRRTLAVSATVIALGVSGAAAAVAATRNTDPVDEQRAEVAYTDSRRADASVTQAEAEAIASDAHAGDIVESHLEDEGNGLVWEVKPDDGTTIWEVQVDASTGAIVSDQQDD